jgi:hypothetical protein
MLQIIDLTVSDEDILEDIARLIKSRRKRLARRVAHKGEMQGQESS